MATLAVACWLATVLASSLPVTMIRDGYGSPLPYFDEDIPSNQSYLTYQFIADNDLDGILEPFADMHIGPKSLSDIDAFSGATYSYVIKRSACPDQGTDCTAYRGTYVYSSEKESESYTTVSIECEPRELFSLALLRVDTSSGAKTTEYGTFMCLYVRREMQSLTEGDLSAVMDAMYVLWSTGEEEGLELYGDKFHNSTYFIGAHDFNAAWIDADHIHEGLGFIPQHIKFTNLFEQAMQAVDPSVTLPYWDYSLEVAEGKALNESVMFREDTFGSLPVPADPAKGFSYRDDGITRISDGRFVDLPSELNSRYATLGNGFGYMRGAWNTNPSPYVSRFSTQDIAVPSCQSIYMFLKEQTDMASFLYQASFAPHAAIHGAVGSAFGCDKMEPLLDLGYLSDYDELLYVCRKWSFAMKELFRSGDVTPRNDCSYSSLEESDVDCGYECDKAANTEISSTLRHWVDGQHRLSDEQMSDWRQFVCTGDGYKIFSGDHLESASPADPSFWPIHGNLERILQARYLSGGFPDFDWPTVAEGKAIGTTNYVCDKPECYDSSTGEKAYSATCCYGHFEHDQLMDFISGDKESGFGPTNRQTLDDTNPASYNMTYIYDSFLWSHCDGAFDGDVNSILLDFYDDSGFGDDAAGEDDDSAAPDPFHFARTLTPVDIAILLGLICLAVGLNFAYYCAERDRGGRYYNISTKKDREAYGYGSEFEESESHPILAPVTVMPAHGASHQQYGVNTSALDRDM